jgi:hypothetical protein
MPDIDHQDARPDTWSPDAQIILIDPNDVRFELLIDPATDVLDWVVMRDNRGEVLAQFAVADTVADTILMPDRSAAATAA